MIDEVNAQLQKSLQPMLELVSANTLALEQLVSQQSALLTRLFEDSVSFTQEVAESRGFDNLLQVQKAYTEEVQQKIAAAAKDIYQVISQAQEKTGQIFQNAVKDVQQVVSL